MNFCSLSGGSEPLGGIVALRATIRNQRQDFVQNRFEFCPKDTASSFYFLFDFAVVNSLKSKETAAGLRHESLFCKAWPN